MSRLFSSTLARAMAAQETGEVVVVLLTITHPDLAVPLRVGSDAVDTVSRGQVFTAYPFELRLPDERDDRPPRAELRLDNVHRDLGLALRQISSPPSVTLEVVLASAPDQVELGPLALELTRAQWDALTVTGELGYDDPLNEPWPAGRYGPAEYPGLFG